MHEPRETGGGVASARVVHWGGTGLGLAALAVGAAAMIALEKRVKAMMRTITGLSAADKLRAAADLLEHEDREIYAAAAEAIVELALHEMRGPRQ